MNTGAHFYRCDFQVHSPRDARWVGDSPTDDDGRLRYADTLIADCRRKGLDAIAITDHHDIVFFRYVKAAAAGEVDQEGHPILEDRRITVFPGMELTLGVPCQALLILDADFPEELLSTLPTILQITPSSATEAHHAQVNVLGHLKSLKEIYERLDQTDYLRGRYIVFPNVSDGGRATLLRAGFASKYKEMPCVGGYLDGSIDKLGSGNRRILDGKDKDYGLKTLGIFQTSDNRRQDHETLGVNTTWVKWAVPTAEGLRQACLARHTRLCQTEPQLPAIVIESVEVSNSKFLGPFNLALNSQFNCLIGGRGTGKSTILEYLRWALADQPPPTSDPGELPDFQAKRRAVVEQTLLPLEASVTISFKMNNVSHVVRRYSKTAEIRLKIGDNEFQQCMESDIRRLLPIHAYSQKQLSGVGTHTEELVRFVRSPIEEQLVELESQKIHLADCVRAAFEALQSQRRIERELQQGQLELSSLGQRIEQLRNDLKGLSDAEQAVLKQQESYVDEETWWSDLSRRAEVHRQALSKLTSDLKNVPALRTPPSGPNLDVLEKARKEFEAVSHEILTRVDEALALLDDRSANMTRIGEIRKEWQQKFDVQQKSYEDAKAKAATDEGALNQIQEAESRQRNVKENAAAREEDYRQVGSPKAEYESARAAWTALYAARGDVLEAQCKALTDLSENTIRATLLRGRGLQSVKERLGALLAGTRIRSKKVDDLCEKLLDAGQPVNEWEAVLDELRSLVETNQAAVNESALPTCPTLCGAAFTASELQRIASQLTMQDWLDLSLTELEDLPVFEYRQREGEYIKFADASAGQQATALMRVLLNQAGPPLVIDQPEDDLDNQVVIEVVQSIWNAKTRRQLIFSSHNANIVVNGDADLVLCCDYRKSGDQSGGQIRLAGAIDMPDIRDEIIAVMDGGPEAFRLRKEKYGF